MLRPFVPCLPCRARPGRAKPGLASPAVPCYTPPRLAAPGLAPPYLPYSTASNPTKPHQTIPYLPYHTSPRPAPPSLTLYHLAAPNRTCHTYATLRGVCLRNPVIFILAQRFEITDHRPDRIDSILYASAECHPVCTP